MQKDGPYLRWACACGYPGLANGPIGPIGPYFTIYPLHILLKKNLDTTSQQRKDRRNKRITMKIYHS